MPTKQKYAAVKLEAAEVAQTSQHLHQPVRSGALTILITVVVLLLAVLSVLALTTARSDLTLTRRLQQTAAAAGTTESAAQEWLASVSACIKSAGDSLTPKSAASALKNLPNGTTVSDSGLVEVAVNVNETELLDIALQIDTSKKQYTVVRWKLVKSWAPDENINVWDGE